MHLYEIIPLVILDVGIRRWRRKNRTDKKLKIKMQNLKDKNLTLFMDNVIKEGKWQVIENTNDMWNDMAKHIN